MINYTTSFFQLRVAHHQKSLSGRGHLHQVKLSKLLSDFGHAIEVQQGHSTFSLGSLPHPPFPLRLIDCGPRFALTLPRVYCPEISRFTDFEVPWPSPLPCKTKSILSFSACGVESLNATMKGIVNQVQGCYSVLFRCS